METFSSLLFGEKKLKQSSASTITTETPRLRPRKSNKKKTSDEIDLDISQDMPIIAVPRIASTQQTKESTVFSISESQQANPNVVNPTFVNPAFVNTISHSQSNQDITNNLLLQLGQKLDSLEEKRKQDKQAIEVKLSTVSKTRNNRQNNKKHYNFKSKANKIQHDMLNDIQSLSEEAKDLVEIGSKKRLASVLDDMSNLLEKRRKVTILADRSPAGWDTVSEYLTDEWASDSDYGKKMRLAEGRAISKQTKESKKQHQFPNTYQIWSTKKLPSPSKWVESQFLKLCKSRYLLSTTKGSNATRYAADVTKSSVANGYQSASSGFISNARSNQVSWALKFVIRDVIFVVGWTIGKTLVLESNPF